MGEPIPGRTTRPIGGKWILVGCLAAVLVVVVPCVAIGVIVLLGARWTGRQEASQDLLRIHREILDSQFDSDAEPTRTALLRELEGVREAARRGRLGLFEWKAYDASLRSVTRDRRVTADEAAYMQRELERLSRAIGADSPAEPEYD